MSKAELRKSAIDNKNENILVRGVNFTLYIQDLYASECAKNITDRNVNYVEMIQQLLLMKINQYLETYHIEFLSKSGYDITKKTFVL